MPAEHRFTNTCLCLFRWDDSEDLAVKAREFIDAGLYSAYRTHKF